MADDARATAGLNERLGRLAEEVPFLPTADILFDRRSPGLFSEEVLEKQADLARGIVIGDEEVQPAIDLLEHEDPRVRTLAILSLFGREDPKLLPPITRLMGDAAETFPTPDPEGGRGPGGMPRLEPQTVGAVASMAIGFYLEAAGLDGFVADEFEEYWEPRRDRDRCASWFAVRLERASQGMRPVREDRVPRIRAIRSEIDDVPEPDRTWILLWLCGVTGWERMAKEEDLVEALKGVGPDPILRLLQGMIPSDDPDLQYSRRTAARYKRMIMLVLLRAKDILRPGDAEILLACEQKETARLRQGVRGAAVTPMWAIAASEMMPGKAEEWLRKALARFTGDRMAEARASLAAALWKLKGTSQSEFLTYWFFEERPAAGDPHPARLRFLQVVQRAGEPDGRPLIARLLKDRRFDDLDERSLRTLIPIVNAFAGKAVIRPKALATDPHPLGEEVLASDPERAFREHPAETEALVRRLADWRGRLRKSVPRWSP